MKLTHLLFVLVALVASLALGSCVGSRKDDGKYRIALTIAPTKVLIERMLDSATLAQVEMNVLLPSGAIPESYEPTVETVAFLEQCDAWYYVGDLGFESKWTEIVKQLNPSIKLIRLDEGLQHILVEHKHGEKTHSIADPHYWFSLQGMQVMVHNLAKALHEVFPDKVNTQALDQQIEQYRSHLPSLEEQRAKAQIPNFIVYHPALTYLVSELGVKQFVIEEDGKEPSPQHLADLSRAWNTDSQGPNTSLAEAHSVRHLGASPRLVVLKEYKDLTLTLAKTYDLQLLLQDSTTPYVLDLFSEDLWGQLDYFYLP